MSKALILTIILLALPIIFNLLLRNKIKKTGIPAIIYPYKKKKFLLDIDEKKFYDSLKLAIKDRNYHLLLKVSLTDIIDVEDIDNRQVYIDKIYSKKIDFLLCDKATLEPLIAIKLDRKGQNESSGVKGDVFLDKTFEAAELPFIRFMVQYEYSALEIQEKINIGS